MTPSLLIAHGDAVVNWLPKPTISLLVAAAGRAFLAHDALQADAVLRSAGQHHLRAHTGLNNDAVSGQANLAYQVTPNVLAYGLYARGEKSGGLNLAALNLVAANPVVQPETVDDYEAGLKTRLFDRRVTINLAAFWTEDHQYQTNIISPYPPYVQYLANIPHVRSRGIEWDAQAQPVHGLNLYTSGAFDQATLVSFPDAPCGIENLNQSTCNLSGRPIPGVSKWAVSAGGEYDHALPTPAETLVEGLRAIGGDGPGRAMALQRLPHELQRRRLVPRLGPVDIVVQPEA